MSSTLSKNKIAFIIPYFGRLPNYFDYWLESCRHNKDINWLIYTDDKTAYNYPENVKVKYMSFVELKKQVQSYFDFTISLDFYYKLTDYKPTYGMIFQNDLKDYDFWGYCDIDLVFGNIRKFITNDILEKNEKILANGHFTLLKNTTKINNIFKSKINDKFKYKEVYSTNKHYGFDEYGKEDFHTICIEQGLNIYINNLLFADINSFTKHFALTYVRVLARKTELETLIWNEEASKQSNIFEFNKGRLFRYFIKNNQIIKKEYMYVHFQKRAMTKEKDNVNIDTFFMVPNKFIINNNNLPIESLIKKGKEKLFPYRRVKRLLRVKIRNFVLKYLGI